MIEKIKVLDDGKGQVSNPHYCKDLSINTCWDMPDSSICDGCRKRAEFEEANPVYDIIGPLSVKAGDEISATLVWQLLPSFCKEWENVIWNDKYTKEQQLKIYEHTRQAWQLTPVKEGEEKPVSKENLHTESILKTFDAVDNSKEKRPCEKLYDLVESEIRWYKIGDGGLMDLYTLLDKIKKIITEFDPLKNQ